jgi:hypothetical protein
MNYQQLDIKPITDDFKQRLLDCVHEKLVSKAAFMGGYSLLETADRGSIAYIESVRVWEKKHGTKWGGVFFYEMPKPLKDELIDYYKDIRHPLFKKSFAIQLIYDSNYVPPHVDDKKQRKQGLIYLVKNGGPDVVTSWYDIKDEHKLKSVPEGTGIPYDNLYKIESHVLQENCWHYMNFECIHGVDNIESARVAINFGAE